MARWIIIRLCLAIVILVGSTILYFHIGPPPQTVDLNSNSILLFKVPPWLPVWWIEASGPTTCQNTSMLGTPFGLVYPFFVTVASCGGEGYLFNPTLFIFDLLLFFVFVSAFWWLLQMIHRKFGVPNPQA